MIVDDLFEDQGSGFNIGDPVIITGNVEFKGKTGDVREIGRDGAFVVVDLYNYGPHSFHSSDVSLNDYANSDDEAEYQSGVAEAFDSPYKVKWDKNKGESHYVDVTLPDGSMLDIRFMRDAGATANPDEWTIEFYRDDTQEITGTGDSQRIFATVIKAIEKFIKLEKPKEIAFAASKITGSGVGNQSRTNLYNRLIQRYAPTWGYDVDISNLKGTTGYKLIRRGKQQGVAEGSDHSLKKVWDRYSKHLMAARGDHPDVRQINKSGAIVRNIRKYVKDHHGQQALDDMERYAEKQQWNEGVAEGSKEDFENWKKTIAPKAAQSAIQNAVNVRAQKQAVAKSITQNDINRALAKKGVAEGYKFKGGFPFDVDHMPGAVHRNADMITDNVKTNDKTHWARAVDSINARVFDDMSEFRTDRHGKTVTGNGAVWAKWDNATQTGWFNAKGRPLRTWAIKEQGVAEEVEDTRRQVNLKKKIDKGTATPEQKKEYEALKAKNTGKKPGVAEASDISGLMTAASMVQDYIITAEVDGQTKRFRVRGMTGPTAARERFLKHASQARVIDVKPAAEKNVAEGDIDEGWKQNLAALGVAGALGLGSVGPAQASTDPASDKIVATLVIDGEQRMLDLSSKNFSDVRAAEKFVRDFMQQRGIDDYQYVIKGKGQTARCAGNCGLDFKPTREGALNEFEMPVGQATGAAAQINNKPKKTYSVKVVGTFTNPTVFMAKQLWSALEEILPRDYPRVPYQQQHATDPQRRVIDDIRDDGFAIVKQGIKSLDIANTIASNFEARQIPAEVISGGLYEDESSQFVPKAGDEILWRPRNAKMAPVPVTVLAINAEKIKIKLQSARLIQQRGGKDTMVVSRATSDIMPKQSVAEASPMDDPDFAAGLAAARAGQGPLAIMLAQPSIANDQKMLDTIASSYNLPAGMSAQDIRTQSGSAALRRALDDVARNLGLPTGLSREELLAAFKKKQLESRLKEADAEKIGDRYDAEEFDQMMLRLKTLAGAGPLKTVWDPERRVYKNVPINPQDKK